MFLLNCKLRERRELSRIYMLSGRPWRHSKRGVCTQCLFPGMSVDSTHGDECDHEYISYTHNSLDGGK